MHITSLSGIFFWRGGKRGPWKQLCLKSQHQDIFKTHQENNKIVLCKVKAMLSKCMSEFQFLIMKDAQI